MVVFVFDLSPVDTEIELEQVFNAVLLLVGISGHRLVLLVEILLGGEVAEVELGMEQKHGHDKDEGRD